MRRRAPLERHVRKEAALHASIAALIGEATTSAIIDRIALGAVDALEADRAVVTWIRGDAIEVRALGPSSPASVRRPFAGSLTAQAVERREPFVCLSSSLGTEDLGIEEATAADRDGPAVIVPLFDASGPLGALFITFEQSDRIIAEADLARAFAFGALAALALRRAELHENAAEKSEELERVIESRSRLMRSFGHGLRNPLGAADGYAQLLENDLFGAMTPEQRSGIARIRGAIRRALTLLDTNLASAQEETKALGIERDDTER